MTVVLAGLLVVFGKIAKRVPVPLVGLVLGSLAFHAAHLMFPNFPLETLGVMRMIDVPVRVVLVDALDFGVFMDWGNWADVARVGVMSSLVITLQALLTFRLAEHQADIQVDSKQALFAQGFANCTSGAITGLLVYPIPALSMFVYRAGARTRITPIVGATGLILFAWAELNFWTNGALSCFGRRSHGHLL
jgi:MFS superfamily sulfate permease-like transporter